MSVSFQTYFNETTPMFSFSQPELIPANQTSGCNSGAWSPIVSGGYYNVNNIINQGAPVQIFDMTPLYGGFFSNTNFTYRYAVSLGVTQISSATPITTVPGGNLTFIATYNGATIASQSVVYNSNTLTYFPLQPWRQVTAVNLAGTFKAVNGATLTVSVRNNTGFDIQQLQCSQGTFSVYQVSSSNTVSPFT